MFTAPINIINFSKSNKLFTRFFLLIVSEFCVSFGVVKPIIAARDYVSGIAVPFNTTAVAQGYCRMKSVLIFFDKNSVFFAVVFVN